VGRRQRSWLDQVDIYSPGRLGTTPLEHFRWALRLAQAEVTTLRPERQEELRVDLATFARLPTGVPLRRNEKPSIREMHQTKADLLNLLSTAMTHQDVRYPLYSPKPQSRILRWSASRGTFMRNGVEVPRGRFIIVDEESWSSLAQKHFCELIARFGHRLSQCRAAAPSVSGKTRANPPQRCRRWFVKIAETQRFCSNTCQTRSSTDKARSHDVPW
jgi:hypothetical protein